MTSARAEAAEMLIDGVSRNTGEDARRDEYLDDFGNGRPSVFRIPADKLHRISERQVEAAS